MDQNSESRSVLIVGGGVIGTASAYYLAKAGWDVTILDRERFGAACSHGNCGLVAVSHVLPLTEPGAVKKALKAMLKSDAPFYIRPRIDLNLWRWLMGFARRCNERDMLSAAHHRDALLSSSRTLYQELLDEEHLECEWESQGCLFVFQTQYEFDKYEKTDTLIRDQFDLGAEKLNGEQLMELEPSVKGGLAGAYYYRMDAHLRPDRLMTAWREKLEQMGVKIIENCEVQSFQADGKSATGVETSQGSMKADRFIVAAGAVTPFLKEHLGCPIPIQPGKGYSITMPRPAKCPNIPMIFQEHKVVVTPMQSGYRLGSTMEFVGYDASMNPTRLDALKRSAAHYLHEPYCEPVEDRWYGWRPMTTDGLPIIDYSPRLENVLISAGHNMLGLSMAPATGKLAMEMLSGHTPHIDVKPFAVSRF